MQFLPAFVGSSITRINYGIVTTGILIPCSETFAISYNVSLQAIAVLTRPGVLAIFEKHGE
jgi:hypothetical protein